MDRFDLEAKIMELYSIVDSLNDISYGILESDLSKDETCNAIDGLAVVTKIKLEQLFDIFNQVHFIDQFSENHLSDCCEENDDFESDKGWD